MELELKNGDYVPDGVGGLRRVDGQAALLQRVLFRLTARRGGFPFREDLGSRLWKLGRLPVSKRQSAAAQYVAEALADEKELEVQAVELGEGTAGVVPLTVTLAWQGEQLPVTLDLRL